MGVSDLQVAGGERNHQSQGVIPVCPQRARFLRGSLPEIVTPKAKATEGNSVCGFTTSFRMASRPCALHGSQVPPPGSMTYWECCDLSAHRESDFQLNAVVQELKSPAAHIPDY